MATQIMLGQYFPGQSTIHQLDPRTKICGVMWLVILLFTIQHFIGYLLFTILILIGMYVSKISIVMYLKSIKPLWIILAITLAVHAATTPGLVLYQLGPLAITQEGLRQGCTMAGRLILLILLSTILTFTTSPIALTDGLERLLNPFRRLGVPAHELAMMMTIALRFIPIIFEETEKIMKAQTARGADFSSGNLIKRATNMVPLLVPLFIGAFRRADDLAMAMEARCYRGGEGRTSAKTYKLATVDYLFFCTVLLLTAVVVYLRMG